MVSETKGTEGLEFKKQSLEQKLQVYKEKVSSEKWITIIGVASLGICICFLITLNSMDLPFVFLSCIATIIFWVTLFVFTNSYYDRKELKSIQEKYQQLLASEEPECNLENICAKLQELSKDISDQELQDLVTELLEVVTKSKECKENLPETYLSETLELLQEYVERGIEKPEGYENLTKYIQSVKECVKEATMTHSEMEEAMFAADVSALVTSIKLQNGK